MNCRHYGTWTRLERGPGEHSTCCWVSEGRDKGPDAMEPWVLNVTSIRASGGIYPSPLCASSIRRVDAGGRVAVHDSIREHHASHRIQMNLKDANGGNIKMMSPIQFKNGSMGFMPSGTVNPLSFFGPLSSPNPRADLTQAESWHDRLLPNRTLGTHIGFFFLGS